MYLLSIRLIFNLLNLANEKFKITFYSTIKYTVLHTNSKELGTHRTLRKINARTFIL